jgi:hypothetical protein
MSVIFESKSVAGAIGASNAHHDRQNNGGVPGVVGGNGTVHTANWLRFPYASDILRTHDISTRTRTHLLDDRHADRAHLHTGVALMVRRARRLPATAPH